VGKVKAEVKFPCALFLTEHQAMKLYCGSGAIASLILWPRLLM